MQQRAPRRYIEKSRLQKRYGQEVAYIADDGCKDTTDKVANDFVVAKNATKQDYWQPTDIF